MKTSILTTAAVATALLLVFPSAAAASANDLKANSPHIEATDFVLDGFVAKGFIKNGGKVAVSASVDAFVDCEKWVGNERQGYRHMAQTFDRSLAVLQDSVTMSMTDRKNTHDKVTGHYWTASVPGADFHATCPTGWTEVVSTSSTGSTARIVVAALDASDQPVLVDGVPLEIVFDL
jgi:hypothetical protein